ncbi:Phosphonate ABC transporter, periplasmic phosphonate-binding protein [Ferriphaselus amnicola]|uniref:Phosphonate ABC transporter, periplasmic phosphonate-binding protein n=2 Tax=Ferriphaselus amnicola TaxID=1188319 RepID=A0A2Z6GEF0_9PROT|nr:Phosphonate ABC transporter, periplasmic phosphonate-binding protein [Ferriphaselus amnicola]
MLGNGTFSRGVYFLINGVYYAKKLFSISPGEGKMRALCLVFLLFLSGYSWAETQAVPLRLALSAVFLGERQDVVVRWRDYLESHLQRPVMFVQRKSYRELTDMLQQGELDAAWICSSPYVKHKSVQKLMAVGVWQGEPLYQSYLIVPATDTTTHSIADLRGKIFAYSDPESNSGYYVAQGELLNLGVDPKHFFSKTMFTYAHRKNVEAVAAGLVNGARVDGYIYDMLNTLYPALIAKTRVVQKSEKFGFPPIVARIDLPQAEFRQLSTVLLNMQNDAEGKALLAALGLDKFVAGNDHLFDGVAELVSKVDRAGGGVNVP